MTKKNKRNKVVRSDECCREDIFCVSILLYKTAEGEKRSENLVFANTHQSIVELR